MAPLLRVKPGGFSQSIDHLGTITEVHSSTCNHCQKITDIPSVRRMMEFVELCRGCMKLVCLENCAGKPCRPWEQECERQEREHEVAKAVARASWGCYPCL